MKHIGAMEKEKNGVIGTVSQPAFNGNICTIHCELFSSGDQKKQFPSLK
jgi:hypothetical protein